MRKGISLNTVFNRKTWPFGLFGIAIVLNCVQLAVSPVSMIWDSKTISALLLEGQRVFGSTAFGSCVQQLGFLRDKLQAHTNDVQIGGGTSCIWC